MIKKPFQSVDRNSNLLDLIHSDICELNEILTRGGNRYFIIFIDDFFRYTYVYLLKHKDEAFNAFKNYKAEVKNQLGKKIKILRSDRGGEYFPNEFNLFCEHGIIHQYFAPRTPEQNGLAERKNITYLEMKVIFFQAKIKSLFIDFIQFIYLVLFYSSIVFSFYVV